MSFLSTETQSGTIAATKGVIFESYWLFGGIEKVSPDQLSIWKDWMDKEFLPLETQASLSQKKFVWSQNNQDQASQWCSWGSCHQSALPPSTERECSSRPEQHLLSLNKSHLQFVQFPTQRWITRSIISMSSSQMQQQQLLIHKFIWKLNRPSLPMVSLGTSEFYLARVRSLEVYDSTMYDPWLIDMLQHIDIKFPTTWEELRCKRFHRYILRALKNPSRERAPAGADAKKTRLATRKGFFLTVRPPHLGGTAVEGGPSRY